MLFALGTTTNAPAAIDGGDVLVGVAAGVETGEVAFLLLEVGGGVALAGAAIMSAQLLGPSCCLALD